MITAAELGARVRAAQKAGQQAQIGAGGGVVVAVSRAGRAAWYARVRQADGRMRSVRLGAYAELSLASAREQARTLSAPPLEQAMTCATALEQWYAFLLPRIGEARRANLKTHVKHLTSLIGLVPLADLTAARVIAAMTGRGLSPALQSALAATVRQFSRWMVAMGYAEHDRCAGIRTLVPRPRSEGWPFLRAEELAGGFFAPLSGMREVYRAFVLMAALTGLRVGTVRALRWAWVQEECIEVPAEAMKMRQPFRVPVTSQVRALLEHISAELRFSTVYVFALQERVPMGLTPLQSTVKALCGGRMSLHGLRKSLRTWLGEQTGEDGMPLYPLEVCELCLAHVQESSVRRVYDKSDLLEPRRRAMRAWGGFLEQGLPEPWRALLR